MKIVSTKLKNLTVDCEQAQCETLPAMQTRITKQITGVYPSISVALKNAVQGFYDTSRNVMSSEAFSIQNILILVGAAPPLAEWIHFMADNADGLTALPGNVSKFLSADKIQAFSEEAFQDLRNETAKYYKKATDGFGKCRTGINNSMTLFTDKVSQNISAAWSLKLSEFNNDYARQIKFMSKLFTDFDSKANTCRFTMPLVNATVCIQNLVRKARKSQAILLLND